MKPFLNPHGTPPVAAACHYQRGLYLRVRGEFREMPGLKLTLDQAARLFAIDRAVCHRVLLALVRDGVLYTDGSTFFGAAGRIPWPSL